MCMFANNGFGHSLLCCTEFATCLLEAPPFCSLLSLFAPLAMLGALQGAYECALWQLSQQLPRADLPPS